MEARKKSPRMHWLKLWTRGWLEGSIRFDLTPAERSVFIDLVALARESRNPPWVQANEITPYPHAWLANKLNIPLELLERTLEKCKKESDPRIIEDGTGIMILKFQEYQEREQPNEISEPESIDPQLAKYGGRQMLITLIYRAKKAKGEEWSADNTRGMSPDELLELAKKLGI